MKGKLKTIFNPQISEYVVVVKRFSWWWILLLFVVLFLVFLLLEFKKSFNIKTIDALSKTPVSNVDVFFQYKNYKLFDFKSKRFFTKDTLTLYNFSDKDGIAKFENVRFTGYHIIFHFLHKAKFFGSTNCNYGQRQKNFLAIASKSTQILELKERLYNYRFVVYDVSTLQPIPNAKVKIIVKTNTNTYSWEKNTEPDGSIYLENVPYCGNYQINASADGFIPANKSGNSEDFYVDDNRKIWLEPQTNSLNFFVKDLFSKMPLPNTKADLVIDGKVIQTVFTNVNGMALSPGEGVFSNVRKGINFTIQVSRQNYADTFCSENSSVWFTLSDSDKVIFMRPLAQSLTFRDIDSKTGLGIPAAKNEIYVNGKKLANPIYSDANGNFSVAGLLPDDVISIVASKPGYNTNDYTIKDKKVSDLLNQPSENRHIPLKPIEQPTPPPPKPPQPPQPQPEPQPEPLPPQVFPCESPQESGGQGVTERVHSIGNSQEFVIEWDMYTVPDQLIVYCGTGPNKQQIFTTRGPVSNRGMATLRCKSNYITVKIIGQREGTQWTYRMNCR